MFRSLVLMYPRSIRIRPSAPPLLFWKVRASTTCSRVTRPILVSTRPIGRPWSWSIGGIVVAAPPAVGAAGAAPAGSRAPPPGVLAGLVGGAIGTLFAGRPDFVGGPLA